MISIHHILKFYIIMIVVFTEVYFIFPWIQLITILNYLLVFTVLLYKGSSYFLLKSEKNIIYIVTIFIFYILVINLYQNNIQTTFGTFLASLPIPFIIYLFFKYERKNEIVFYFAKFYLIYNTLFSFLQLIGIHITSNEILSKLPLLGTDRGFVGYGNQGLRISGAGSSTISLACIIGIIFIIFYYYKNNDSLLRFKERKLYLLLIFVLIIMTQTRSLIFSLPLVIILSGLIVSENRIKGLLITGLGTIIFIILIFISLPLLEEIFPRLFLSIDEDGSLVHRIQANIYGSIGTFYMAPLIGVSFDNALNSMIYGFNEIGLFVGYRFIDEVTYHNQFFYYFRHYGFIGLFLYLFMLISIIYNALNKNRTEFNKKILISIIAFYFLYTLTHNNKWNMDFYLWIFLSLSFTINKLEIGKNINEK